MNRSTRFISLQVKSACMAGMLLTMCLCAGAQNAPTTAPLTPAQQRAADARAARQAAAQQAAQNRAAAAQARAAAKNTPSGNTAAPRAGANPAANSAPGTGNTTRPGGLPGTSTNPAAPQRNMGSGTVGSGTLAWQTRVYSSSGCQHNGNSAECTFTFTNQGNEATLVAGAELQGVQLVDDAHVPHKADSAHFMDKYGSQQPRLLVQPGDTGTYVLTFPNVNPQVSSAEFHLRQQIVGGITFSAASSTATAPTNAPTNAPKTTPK